MYRLLIFGAICQSGFTLPLTNICRTSDCLYLANSIKEKWNRSVEPCDDFYEFTCGRFSPEMPHDSDESNIFGVIAKNLTRELIDMLEDNTNTSSTTMAFKKFQAVYRNCMDLDAAEKDGFEIIISRLQESGGWPMMMTSRNWTQDKSLSRILGYHTSELGFIPLFFINGVPDPKNTSLNRLLIEPNYQTPFDGLLRAYERSEQEVRQYEEFITNAVNVFAKATKNDRNWIKVQRAVTEMLDFGEKLMEIVADLGYTPGAYESVTIRNFQSWYNNISTTENSKITWNDLLRESVKYTDILLTDDSMVLVNKKYIEPLIRLMDKSSIRTIVNFIQWNFINNLLEAEPEQLRNIISGSSQTRIPLQERKEFCAEVVSSHHAVGHQFVRAHFSGDSMVKANEIISEVILSIEELLRKTPWLKNRERQYWYAKLRDMARLLGYPEWYGDLTRVEDYYKEFDVKDNYLDNLIDLNRFKYTVDLKEIVKPIPRQEFFGYPTEINSHYEPSLNAILFPAAMLRKPVLESGMPLFSQYSIFGNIAGHEISHSFDPEGVKFGAIGSPSSGWSNTTNTMYESKVQCFIDQYSNYTVYKSATGLKNMRGDNSKHENISDLYGLKAAYAAYLRRKTAEDERLRLPGLESYNDNQLFFMSYASFWCAANSATYLEHKASTADHPISRFRVIGTLSNMKEFSDAFNCPDNSRMNRRHKCTIWGTNNA